MSARICWSHIFYVSLPFCFGSFSLKRVQFYYMCVVEFQRIVDIMIWKQVLCFSILLAIAVKIQKVKKFSNSNSDGPYGKVDILPNIFGTDRISILNKEVQLTTNSSILYSLEEKSASFCIVVLSAPKNVKNRSETRRLLSELNRTDVKWFFVIGKTGQEAQVSFLFIWGILHE